jgi:SAM-dependent methyltransferase
LQNKVRAEFDGVGETYQAAVDEAISFAGQEHDFYLQAKARRLVELTRRRLGPGRHAALDVGCGPGLFDRHVASEFDLHGVDVSPAMVERAREANPEVEYAVSEPRRLPHGDGRFDLAFAVCVLHHVDRADRLPLVRELARVVRPGGLVSVFEHNPLNPLTRRVVRTCAFDEDVELLPRRELEALFGSAGLEEVSTHYLLFFPWRGRLFEAAERLLTAVPLGAQYVVAGRRGA